MKTKNLRSNEKKIEFLASFAKGIPLIKVDPKLLAMVIQNLLSNALNYTSEKGRVSLTLALAKAGAQIGKEKADKNCLVIIVSDTGFGIPQEQQDKIFSKLFRADNVREKDTEGTGLGLYIVKSIIEHSSGKVWFESPSSAQAVAGQEKNPGTTFYVTLPLTGMKKKAAIKGPE